MQKRTAADIRRKNIYSNTDGAINIHLPHGIISIIDPADMVMAVKYKWCSNKCGNTSYVVTRTPINSGCKLISLHRYLLNAPIGSTVDHVNGNTLDNRRINLRICTHAENLQNRGPQKNNTSGYKGVVWDKSRGKWMAKIKVNGKNIYIGRFNAREEAFIAYTESARKHHKEFARTK